jgi:hypothetical protein
MEMLKSKKSQVTCSYCSKIFKDPIDLPCGDSICREHLSERTVVKTNRIKCNKCNEEFGVKNNEFKSNNQLKHSIESHSHLSDQELGLKQELEESIKKFFEFYDKFDQNRTKLESNIFDHFHEMRFKIDEQREELKKRIDDIALAMVDQTKKSENVYLNSLKERFSSFDDCESLEAELNGIEEKFRNPNLLFETIRAMQQKQDESLGDIQIKLKEMTKINDDLMETNFFMSNSSLFTKEEDTSLFGSIRLGQYTNVDLFNSQILNGERQITDLIKLCEFSPNDKWTVLYRGTRDGFGSKDFHSKCDGHSNTLTIVKAKGSEFIFGGYMMVSWDCSSGFKSDPNAFLFSLTNGDKRPVKMKVDPNKSQYAIRCDSRWGPSFGGDICIANNANTTMDSYSYLGLSYLHPQYAQGKMKLKHFWLDQIFFNWMKLKFMKRNNKRNRKNSYYKYFTLLIFFVT